MSWLPWRRRPERATTNGAGGPETLWFRLNPEVARGGTGVTRLVRERVAPGLNLYSAADAPAATLMDMEGREVHRWSAATEEVWTGEERAARRTVEGSGFWRSVVAMPGGDLIALQKHLGVFRLDARSRVVWKFPCDAHHQVVVSSTGEIVTLDRRVRRARELVGQPEFLDDGIVWLGADGRERRRVSVLDAFTGGFHASSVKLSGKGADGGPHRLGDTYHPVSLQLLESAGRIGGGAFPAGSVLLGFRKARRVALIQTDPVRPLWFADGPWVDLHDAQLVESERILVFDSLALEGRYGRSSVVEWDARSGEVTWACEASPGCPLDSPKGGAVQALPRGNVLITEAAGGRALEVTREGEVVWEFILPQRGGSRGELIPYLCSVRRISADAESGVM